MCGSHVLITPAFGRDMYQQGGKQYGIGKMDPDTGT